VQQWLSTHQFEKLEERYNGFQSQYEAGLLNDWALLIKYQAFYDTASENEDHLNLWIKDFPRSYPARLARGIYYRKVGEAKRGSSWIRETPKENLAQLSIYLDRATDDLLASRPLTSKPIVSIIHLMNVTKHRDGDRGNRYWLEEANRIDPSNFGARRRYMLTLTPRWGGSYAEMYAFLEECRAQRISSEHIRIFESIIHSDLGNMLRHDRRQGEALKHYREALILLSGIENGEMMESLKGLIHSAKESNALPRVAEDIDRYLRLAPRDAKILSYRGWLREKQGRLGEAMEDFKTAASEGDAWSQYRVGQSLITNMSSTTEEARNEGLTWLRRSAQQGYEPARRLLQQLE
jgi:tetratricopeptide (TPR) repeat protein